MKHFIFVHDYTVSLTVAVFLFSHINWAPSADLSMGVFAYSFMSMFFFFSFVLFMSTELAGIQKW